MAGSRLQKIGSIFSRTSGLLRSGAMKEEDKPLWYDIYKAFPPKNEPCFTRPAPQNEIPTIFYKEDVIRAKFYKEFGSPGIIDMNNEKTSSLSQRFIEKYTELENSGALENVFEETVKYLEADGVTFVRSLTVQDDSVTSKEPYNVPIVTPVATNSKIC